MKILLTGVPHVGKSTLLNELIIGIHNKHGFVTNEVLTEGRRTGFEVVSSRGVRELLASVDSPSEMRVSKYGVNLLGFDTFLTNLETVPNDALIYIDEIGQMELYSEYFKKLVSSYLSFPNPFVGTLSSVYEDEFTASLRDLNDIEIINLTIENRYRIRAELKARVAKYAH